MLIPYNVDVPMQRWPIANWVLIGITVIASFIFWGSDEMLISAGVWRDEDFSVTQLVTYLLAHGDFFHLAGNMLFLFVFGNAVNAKLGHLLYVMLYVSTGVLAALAWLASGDDGLLIGASGAIMGVVGAFMVFYPRNDISVWYWFGFIAAGTFSLSSYWMILLYVAFDIWGVIRQGDGGGVAYISHLVGAAAGLGASAVLLATGLVKPSAAEQTLFQAIRGSGGKKKSARKNAPGSTPLRPPESRRPVPMDEEPIPLVGDEPPPKTLSKPAVKPPSPPRKT